MHKAVLVGCVALGYGLSLTALAQESMPGKLITCYGTTAVRQTHLAPARSMLRVEQKSATASLDVTFVGFPPGVVPAFQQAIDTWKNLLQSPVPIRIRAVWSSLSGSALASTGATKLYRGFAGAVQPDVWYPVALAEKITGRDLNGTDQPDITITLNSDAAWYSGLDGKTPADQTDLITVVLHELAHGLGFVSSADVRDTTGQLRDDGYLSIYDRLLENRTGVRLSAYADPSADLAVALTSDNVYLHSTTAASTNQGQFPKVQAPGVFIKGSSSSHLDEAAYPPGDANSLMTPYFARGESIHVTGNLLMGVLADLGWTTSNTAQNALSVFPNPGTGVYTIQFPVGTVVSGVQVVNTLGQVMQTEVSPVSETLRHVNITPLPNGVYTLIITTDTGLERRKIVLMR